jgi:hypothetical protein
MNKFLKLVIILLPLSLSIQTKAQEVGGGLLIATDEVFNLGLDFRGTYAFNEDWRGAFSVDYFFPQKESFVVLGTVSELTYSAVSFNFEANYFVEEMELAFARVYAIAGLNYINVNVSGETTGPGGVTLLDASGNDSGVNINLGLGLDFNSSQNLVPFSEIKFSLGESNDLLLLGGVKFMLN